MGCFGERLKKLRKEKDISLRQMAKILGITPPYLSRIENGHEHPPKAEHISKMAEILGIDESVLFELVPTDLKNKRIPDEIVEGYQKDGVSKKKVPEFFRSVKKAKLTEEEWDELIEEVKKKGSKK